MPPRYAYWTILVDDQPTAFRAASQEDLLPTFKRLKLKHASAKMMWWQSGKLWDSRLDAQAAMHARGEMGRRGDFRQRQQERPQGKLEWRPKTAGTSSGPHALKPSTPPRAKRESGLDWKPKGDAASPRDRKPRFERPEWKPKGARVDRRPPFKDRQAPGSESTKLEWKPKGDTAAPKRKWIPKEEFKTSQVRSLKPQAPRDKNWRPGGDHQDPRQKYKDAKKAKWGRFKQTIRRRWKSKQGKRKQDDE